MVDSSVQPSGNEWFGASRDHLEEILHGISDGITVQDTTGALVFANVASARTLGFESVEELLAAPLDRVMERFELFDEADAPFPLRDLPGRRVLLGEDPPEVVLRFRAVATGVDRWSVVKSSAIRDSEGKVAFAVNSFRDFTARRRLEERAQLLAEAGARLAGSLTAADTFAAISDLVVPRLADWYTLYLADSPSGVRRAAMAVVNPAHQAAIDDLNARFAPLDRPDHPINVVVRTGKPILVPEVSLASYANRSDDPEYAEAVLRIGLRSFIVAPLTARDRTLGAISLAIVGASRRYDNADASLVEELAARIAVTLETAELYDSVERARAQAEAAVKARDQFLSIAAHELRTPVAGITGMVQLLQRLLKRGALDTPRLERSLGTLRHASRRLATLVEDFLDVTRIQAGRLAIQPAPTDLVHLVNQIVAEHLDQHADQSDISIRSSIAAFTAEVDPTRIHQVVGNLLDNARKYSPDGGPIVVTIEPAGAGIEIAVRDQGIGLPTGSEETIFELFGRAENAERTTVPGVGLGLYISRQILAQHGGHIRAESSGEGQGATMRIWLPGS